MALALGASRGRKLAGGPHIQALEVFSLPKYQPLPDKS